MTLDYSNSLIHLIHFFFYIKRIGINRLQFLPLRKCDLAGEADGKTNSQCVSVCVERKRGRERGRGKERERKEGKVEGEK